MSSDAPRMGTHTPADTHSRLLHAHTRRWTHTLTGGCSRTGKQTHTGVWCPSFHLWRSYSFSLLHSLALLLGWEGRWGGGSYSGHMTQCCCCCCSLCVGGVRLHVCMAAHVHTFDGADVIFVCMCVNVALKTVSICSVCSSVCFLVCVCV